MACRSFKVVCKPVHPFPDVLQGIGVGKAQVALTVLSEIDAGSNTDMRPLQDVESRLIGVLRKGR